MINLLNNEFNIIQFKTIEIISTKFKGKLLLIAEEILFLLKLIANTYKLYNKNIICGSHHYSTLLYFRLLKLFNTNNKIYIFNFYIHETSKYSFTKNILKILFNQKMGMMVQSNNEINFFNKISNNITISYFPFCMNEIVFNKNSNFSYHDYIFSGGYTNRDYGLLIESSKKFPDIKFIIVCSNLNNLPSIIPPNVIVLKNLPSDLFHSYLFNSKIVIISLKEDVGSSGQMVALAAMQAEKPIIYPSFDVISQYFDNFINGVEYEAGKTLSLNNAISYCIENNKTAINIGGNAKMKYYKNFQRKNYLEALKININNFF